MGLGNGKSLKDYLVRANLPRICNVRSSEPWGKTACQVCNYIIRTYTFTTKAWGKVSKIQNGRPKWNSEKVIYLLRHNIHDDNPCVGNAKKKFHLHFKNYKSKNRSFRKRKQNVPQKRFHSLYVQDYYKGIDDWEVTLSEKWETYKQLKSGNF